MATLAEMVSDILKELSAIQRSPERPIDKDSPIPIPRMIGTGDGNYIIISKKIDQLITHLARRIQQNDPSLATSFTDAEWNNTVRNAFGPALSQIDLDDDLEANARTVLSDVKDIIRKHYATNNEREYAFGCTLFSNTDISGFEIGPARFEPRNDWLDRKTFDKAISNITYRRIKQAWQGKKVSKRKSSYDSIREKDVLDAIGKCPYVCSVSTIGFGAEFGKEKALTAARLALAAIALLWETPSKALEGFNLLFDRSVRRQKTLSFVPGKIILAGSRLSHMPHGPYLKPGEWNKQFKASQRHFQIAGEIIGYLLSADGKVNRPKMMNTLCQALLWFHEGCRETVTLIAIVKFAAAMDALACGRENEGIRRLINKQLGIKDEASIRPGGPSMKEVINQIYGPGRSRTIHGTNDKLGHDWTVIRGLAEQFARLCLVSCIDWAGANPSVDDPLLLAK